MALRFRCTSSKSRIFELESEAVELQRASRSAHLTARAALAIGQVANIGLMQGDQVACVQFNRFSISV